MALGRDFVFDQDCAMAGFGVLELGVEFRSDLRRFVDAVDVADQRNLAVKLAVDDQGRHCFLRLPA